MQPFDGSATDVVPHQWNWCAREIEGVAELVRDHLHHRGIVDILRRIDHALQRAHSCAALDERLDEVGQQIRLQRDLISL